MDFARVELVLEEPVIHEPGSGKKTKPQAASSTGTDVAEPQNSGPGSTGH